MGGSGQRVGLIGGVIGAAFAYVSLRLLSWLFRYVSCSSGFSFFVAHIK